MTIPDSLQSSKDQKGGSPGPFLAKVIGHMDATFMGVLEVEILRPSGNLNNTSETVQVKYMSPFYGVTSSNHLGSAEDYNSTQKSYGMWMVPPDVGTIVVVIFIDGDPRRGYWMGCVLDEGMNFMLPGLAATQKVVEDPEADNAGRLGRVPVAEYNKKTTEKIPDVTQALKPRHPFTDVLDRQGLLFDDIRGITTSSARREVPSMVFGISTPGPRDKQNGAQRGKLGATGKHVDNAFVSRLGGSTFVMDDGDDRFLRKTEAKDGPPEYANVEDGEKDGKVTIPHNELVRIRTRTGHQILLHNSEDLIYITNARGTSWIELSSDGKIDIFAQDSISMHTTGDFNFKAARNINMECGNNFNLSVGGASTTEIVSTQTIKVGAYSNIEIKGASDTLVTGAVNHTYKAAYNLNVTGATTLTTAAAMDIKSGAALKITAGGNASIGAANLIFSGGRIDLNGPAAPAAATAAKAKTVEPLHIFKLPDSTGSLNISSIMKRVPTTEPWPHHENLDPNKFKLDKTDNKVEEDIAVPDTWKTYSTKAETFKTIPPPATEEEQQ
jgi:hypothetical protein